MALIRQTARQHDLEQSNSLHSHLSRKIDLTPVVLCATRDETSALIRIVSYASVQSNGIVLSTTLCAQMKEIFPYFVCDIFEMSNVGFMPYSVVALYVTFLALLFVMFGADYLIIEGCVSYCVAVTKHLFVSFQRLIKYWRL